MEKSKKQISKIPKTKKQNKREIMRKKVRQTATKNMENMNCPITVDVFLHSVDQGLCQ